jgi:hypothetical protein
MDDSCVFSGNLRFYPPLCNAALMGAPHKNAAVDVGGRRHTLSLGPDRL